MAPKFHAGILASRRGSVRQLAGRAVGRPCAGLPASQADSLAGSSGCGVRGVPGDSACKVAQGVRGVCFAEQGYAKQGYAKQGYAKQGYAKQGHAKTISSASTSIEADASSSTAASAEAKASSSAGASTEADANSSATAAASITH